MSKCPYCKDDYGRLVVMPDPTKSHEKIDGTAVTWLVLNHGGEWRKHDGRGCRWWKGAATPQGHEKGGYDWRPEKPEPVVAEKLYLDQVFEHLDAHGGYATHPEAAGEWELSSDGGLKRRDAGCYSRLLTTRGTLAGWTHTYTPGEEE